MMIKTKLKIVVYLCATLAAISSIAVIYSFRHMERKLEERRDIHAITRGIFDLNILADEYLLYRERRPLEQWNHKYSDLASLIGIGSREPTHGAYLVSLEGDYKDVKYLFSRLISVHKSPPFQDNVELYRRLENRLQSQVLIKSQELVTHADRIERRAERELLIGQKRIGWIILGIILSVSGSVIGLILFIRQGVAKPFENLIKGVESIGSGTLDVRIDSKPQNEIGDLSRSFNRMAGQLRTTMISRDELEGEVAKRSAKLAQTNTQLKAEIEERKRREEELRHAQENLRKQLQFEELISRISSEFINVPHNQIDNKIKTSLELVAETLDVDRCLFHEFSEDRKFFHVTQVFLKPGIKRPSSTITSESCPWLTKTILNREIAKTERIDDLPEEAEMEKKYWLKQDVKSAIAIPLIVGGGSIGALNFSTVHSARSWPDEDVRQFKLISEVFANALDRKQKEQGLQSAFLEIKQLKDRLQQENIYLREEIKLEHKHGEIIGKSNAIKYVLRQAEQVAQTNSTVLVQGETGTGKELLARRIHNLSSRKERALVTVNCSALPPGLIESELFGREKGAYTGALTKQLGRFEIADGSTIFLDEVSELPLELQAKLLRVLQDAKFERLGSTDTIEVDVRVIAATNRDLAKAVSEGSFREDLYYRLHVFPITVPALHERKEDIPLLVWEFVREFEKSMGKRITNIKQARMEEMQRYPWPGNVRELRNVVEQAMIVSKGRTLNLRVPEAMIPGTSQDFRLETLERNHIITILEKSGWRVKGKNGAAKLLGLHPSTLFSKMKKLGIKRTTNSGEISSRG